MLPQSGKEQRSREPIPEKLIFLLLYSVLRVFTKRKFLILFMFTHVPNILHCIQWKIVSKMMHFRAVNDPVNLMSIEDVLCLLLLVIPLHLRPADLSAAWHFTTLCGTTPNNRKLGLVYLLLLWSLDFGLVQSWISIPTLSHNLFCTVFIHDATHPFFIWAWNKQQPCIWWHNLYYWHSREIYMRWPGIELTLSTSLHYQCTCLNKLK